MQIFTSSTLNASSSDVFRLVCEKGTLAYLGEGFMRYDGIHEGSWEVDKEVNLKPRLFGIPQGDHYVTFKKIIWAPKVQSGILTTEEYGGSIKSWRHTMLVTPATDQTCLYTDIVKIDAGWQTFPVWVVAQLLYRHRHKRWPLLLEQKL